MLGVNHRVVRDHKGWWWVVSIVGNRVNYHTTSEYGNDYCSVNEWNLWCDHKDRFICGFNDYYKLL